MRLKQLQIHLSDVYSSHNFVVFIYMSDSALFSFTLAVFNPIRVLVASSDLSDVSRWADHEGSSMGVQSLPCDKQSSSFEPGPKQSQP